MPCGASSPRPEARARDRRRRAAARTRQRLHRLFATALGLATFVVRIWAPTGEWYEPWHQEFAHYPQYVAMFVIGILAYRLDWLNRFPDAQARLWRWLIPVIVVALIGVAGAAGVFGGTLNPEAAGSFNWLALVYAMWEDGPALP